MQTGLLLSMALLGLASGVHCVAMCGGLVTAFSTRRVIPIAVSAGSGRDAPWRRQVLLNAGRLATYAALGAAAGAIGHAATGFFPLQAGLYVLANLMLILAGLHLAGASALLARVESIGRPLWRRLQPWAARFADRPLAAGLLWGFLPCGLVYSALATASLAGSAEGGAAAMLAFGAGTAPNLLAAGLAAARLRAWFHRRWVRTAAGSAVLGFGLYGLAHAGSIGSRLPPMFCL